MTIKETINGLTQRYSALSRNGKIGVWVAGVLVVGIIGAAVDSDDTDSTPDTAAATVTTTVPEETTTTEAETTTSTTTTTTTTTTTLPPTTTTTAAPVKTYPPTMRNDDDVMYVNAAKFASENFLFADDQQMWDTAILYCEAIDAWGGGYDAAIFIGNQMIEQGQSSTDAAAIASLALLRICPEHDKGA